MIGGHIATKADKDVLDEHKSDVQKQWDVIAKEVSFPFLQLSTMHTKCLLTVIRPAAVRSSRTSFHNALCKRHTLVGWPRLLSVPKDTGAITLS